MWHDDRGGIRHPSGRRLLTSYNAGYAAAMRRAHADLERLNIKLQAELAKVRAEIDELKLLMQLRQRSVMERVQRMKESQAGLNTQRDPTRPLQ